MGCDLMTLEAQDSVEGGSSMGRLALANFSETGQLPQFPVVAIRYKHFALRREPACAGF